MNDYQQPGTASAGRTMSATAAMSATTELSVTAEIMTGSIYRSPGARALVAQRATGLK
jgi:hypothetical protein